MLTAGARWLVIERAAFAKGGLAASLYHDYLPVWVTHEKAKLHGLEFYCRVDNRPDLAGLSLAELKEEYAVRGEL